MVHLEHVDKIFRQQGKQIHAVKDVTLSIQDGEIFGIIGFSGAGKSTLVRCINLLERPTSGKVIIDGIELTALKEKELRKVRKKIGMIFQQFHLFASRTVFQNVAYPLYHSGMKKEEIEKRVTDLLELVDLSQKAQAYPSQLSGGQKQRVAIARALANDPNILLCDEATSALDPQNTAAILQLLQELNRKLGLTIIIITHEMQVIKEICHKVAVMENGSIVEEGDVFSVFSNPSQPITREFIDTTSNLSKIYRLLDEKSEIAALSGNECLVRLKYIRHSSTEPLVSTVSRKYNVDVNIIFGNLEVIDSSPLGGLIAIFRGKQEDVQAALAYFKEKNVEVEVIADGGIFTRADTKRVG